MLLSKGYGQFSQFKQGLYFQPLPTRRYKAITSSTSAARTLSPSLPRSWIPVTPHIPVTGAIGAESRGSAQGPRHCTSSTANGNRSPRYLS